MKYETLIIERGVRGGRLKKPVTVKVPERQNMARAHDIKVGVYLASICYSDRKKRFIRIYDRCFV